MFLENIELLFRQLWDGVLTPFLNSSKNWCLLYTYRSCTLLRVVGINNPFTCNFGVTSFL